MSKFCIMRFQKYKVGSVANIGIDRAVLEQIMQMALGDLHFIMRDIEKPTTDELKEIVAEVEQMVNGLETC